MRILVLNTGSSSVKYRLFDGSETLAKGLIERIGEAGGDTPDHEAALRQIMDTLDVRGLDAVGHRVVHGGSEFDRPTVIDDTVVATIERLVPLAPLHNPPALAAISVARKLLPDIPQVAVFDTAFHATIPAEGRTFAIDTDLAERWHIRRYGFHGSSHAYVSRRTAELLGLDYGTADLITLHLGNGASACAIRGGHSVATSMGMSPQGGLVMGTRSGDIDPTVVFHLHRVAGMPIEEIERSLTRRAGLLGLAGDNDMRSVEERTDERARLAFDVFCRRIREYLGAYLAVLGRADAVAFTGGIGENSPLVRHAVTTGLSGLGIELDEARNQAGETVISSDKSGVTLCVVRTDEELEIALQSRIALTA
ncbi:MAG TPA: acetate kinase [Actinoplanes sp.]|nr:acetate kinase [Actinoplanes sp.]